MKPTFKLKKGSEGTDYVLIVDGDLNVQHAQEMKKQLFKVVDKEGSVHLDFSKASAFDPTAIQLTYLVKKEVERAGRKVIVSLPEASPLKSLLEKTGITKFL